MPKRTFSERVGKNLNEILYDKKISQTELARAVDVSNMTISKLVNGTRVPSAEKLTQIEAYLGVSHERLTR